MKISIIIPVYNSNQYLKECIDSILKQTYSDFEIILVDDGSTDNSPRICDEYASRDQRIRVIHKINGGTSDARNKGIAEAVGDYITFMDNDDYWSDACALEQMTKLIQTTNPDVIMHTNMTYWQNKEKTVAPCSFDRMLVSGKPHVEAINQLLKVGVLTVTVWTKVIKTSLIREHDLYFKKGIRNEDTDWIARLLLYAKSYEWYDLPFYVYRKGHETAQTSQKLTYSMVNDLKNILIEYADYATEHLPEAHRGALYAYLAYPYAVWMGQSCLIEQDKAIKEDKRNMKKYAFLLSYDVQPAVKMVHIAYRILGFHLTSMLLMLYIKKVYYS